MSVLEPWVKHVPPWVSGIFILAALSSVAFWIFQRTVSLHVFRLRVWRLFHGRSEITDPAVKAYIDERTNAQAFAFFSGVVVPSTRSPSEVLAWCRARKVSVHALGRCGAYFDLDSMQPTGRRPWIWLHAPMALVFAALAFLTVWQLASKPETTLLSLRASGTYFWAGSHSIRSFTQPLPWVNDYTPLTAATCRKQTTDWAALGRRTGFSAADTQALCDVLDHADDWHAFITKALTPTSATTNTILLIECLFLLVFFLHHVVSWLSVGWMRERLAAYEGVTGPPPPWGRLRRWWQRRAMAG